MSLPFPDPATLREQELLVLQIGDSPDGLLQNVVGDLWNRYTYLSGVWPQLQRLYTQRDLLDIAWTQVRGAVSFSLAAAGGSGGSTGMQLSDKARQLMSMRQAVQAEIERMEAMARGAQAPQVGQLTAVAPIGPPFPWGFDANAQALTGSPYEPPIGLADPTSLAIVSDLDALS